MTATHQRLISECLGYANWDVSGPAVSQSAVASLEIGSQQIKRVTVLGA